MDEALDGLIKRNQRPNSQDGDYIGDDGRIYCGKCRTPKQFSFPCPWHGGAIVLVNCLCKCGEERRQRLEEAETAEKFRQRVAELRNSGLHDKAYHRWTFDADDRRNARVSDACRRYVDSWRTAERNNTWLLFSGGVGTGKTFYAAAIANALIDKGVPVMMASVPNLLGRIQAEGFGNGREGVFDDLAWYPLAVLDDLGAERSTDYAVEQVFRLMDVRYSSGKPTIVTTNLYPKDMANPGNSAMRRVYDRVLENSVRIPVTGDSRRIVAARTNHDAEARRLWLT